MEMLMVVYNTSIDEEVLEALKKAGMKCYTKFVNLRGAGECSEPRLNTQVWPGTNSMLLVFCELQAREGLLQAVRVLKERHREEGVRAFVVPVTECL
jgi:hypothetical protein